MAGIFSYTVSPLEMMLLGTLMYWFLFSALRFVLRRDVGSLGMRDFLFVVILGDAAQNSMIGSVTSATDGTVLRNMRREAITDEEVNAKFRHEGVEDLATVERTYHEEDGEMSLIRQKEPRASA